MGDFNKKVENVGQRRGKTVGSYGLEGSCERGNTLSNGAYTISLLLPTLARRYNKLQKKFQNAIKNTRAYLSGDGKFDHNSANAKVYTLLKHVFKLKRRNRFKRDLLIGLKTNRKMKNSKR